MRLRGEMLGLRKRCDAKLASLSLPEPFSIPALVASIESAQSRSIQLIAVDEPQGDLRTTCDLRFRQGAVTYVPYRPRPTPHQTEHKILHALAHEWLGHGIGLPSDVAPHELSASVRRPIGTKPLSRQIVHARSRFESTEEREAELSAYLIKRRVRATGSGADLISRLESTLTHRLGPQRRRGLWGG